MIALNSLSRGFPQSQLLTQSGRDKRCPILKETAKTKLLDESANFSEEGMELSHAPAPLPLIDHRQALSLLEEIQRADPILTA